MFYFLNNFIMDTRVQVTWSDGKIYLRQPCQLFTRVMGYLRPVSHYNIWKKSEFYSRKYFTEQKIANSEFIRKYSEDATANA
jgi:hypothetical protein